MNPGHMPPEACRAKKTNAGQTSALESPYSHSPGHNCAQHVCKRTQGVLQACGQVETALSTVNFSGAVKATEWTEQQHLWSSSRAEQAIKTRGWAIRQEVWRRWTERNDSE
ncbi:hypothetical protein KIL84_004368 [Mauremys mutica]|uniref:Uncharacterized protein n=1 Tax=Mauremys mutica TaxID=74926 RepID=A0A9D3XN11_9SAUR|nr:hypothetical protein KIL84_004368 [Mauremys mutica]